jgi:hypothetical protein
MRIYKTRGIKCLRQNVIVAVFFDVLLHYMDYFRDLTL